jgi:hypothetical protein
MCRCGHSLVSIYQGTKSSHCMHTEHLLVLKSVQNSNNSSTKQLISSHDQQPLRHMVRSGLGRLLLLLLLLLPPPLPPRLPFVPGCDRRRTAPHSSLAEPAWLLQGSG